MDAMTKIFKDRIQSKPDKCPRCSNLHFTFHDNFKWATCVGCDLHIDLSL